MSESAETTNQVSDINEETVSQDELAPLPELTKDSSQQSDQVIHSENLNLDFNVHIQGDRTNDTQQKCYIMTLHDLGCDYKSFEEFISCPEMKALKERVIWIHVDLPGQEAKASDLKITKYPSLEEIGQELVIVLDALNIQRVVCLGEGAGANIAARFAIKNSTRCSGVVLVHPTGSSASFMEQFKERILNKFPNLINHSGIISEWHENYLIWHRYKHGASKENEDLLKANIREFLAKLYAERNPKNLSILVDAYLNRSNINDSVAELKTDVLTAVGKKASLASEAIKFFKSLQSSRKDKKDSLVNCSLLELDEVCDILGEAPDKVAISLQYFLQGAGLLSAMPMKQTLQGMGRNSRTFSMEDADKPKLRQSLSKN